MGIEENIENFAFNSAKDKTFVDKLLGRQDSENIRKLMKKERLSREDINQILNMLSSPLSKLWNFNDWERHVILKFFVWVREYARMCQLLYDYDEDLTTKSKICISCGKKLEKECECEDEKTANLYNELIEIYNKQVEIIYLRFGKKYEYKELKKVKVSKFKITTRTKQMLLNNKRQMEHNIKFLIDLYLNIGNTSLSVSATAFKEILANKFEINYGSQQGIYTPVEDVKSGGFLK